MNQSTELRKERETLEKLALKCVPSAIYSEMYDCIDVLMDDELLAIIQHSEVNLLDDNNPVAGVTCPKRRFRLLFGYVRRQGNYWDQSLVETYCKMNGKIGRAILYALERVENYEPVMNAMTCKIWSGVSLLSTRTTFVSRRLP